MNIAPHPSAFAGDSYALAGAALRRPPKTGRPLPADGAEPPLRISPRRTDARIVEQGPLPGSIRVQRGIGLNPVEKSQSRSLPGREGAAGMGLPLLGSVDYWAASTIFMVWTSLSHPQKVVTSPVTVGMSTRSVLAMTMFWRW